jgi:RimJ/RimL family protein N-acetyltransferase
MVSILSPCTDSDTLVAIGNHPKVLRHITDDFNSRFEPNDKHLYLVCEDKGFVSFEPLNHICYSAHIALMPELWGRSEEIGRAAVDFVFTKTICRKIVAMIPDSNRRALRVGKCFGKQEGLIREAFSKGFKLRDLVVFGLTKEEWLCQQQ